MQAKRISPPSGSMHATHQMYKLKKTGLTDFWQDQINKVLLVHIGPAIYELPRSADMSNPKPYSSMTRCDLAVI